MKTAQPNDPDDALNRALSAWKAEVEIPPQFQSEVWRRISALEITRNESLWTQLAKWLDLQFAAPARAALVLAIALAIGVGFAFIQARDANARQLRQLEMRYIDSINPLAQGAPYST